MNGWSDKQGRPGGRAGRAAALFLAFASAAQTSFALALPAKPAAACPAVVRCPESDFVADVFAPGYGHAASGASSSHTAPGYLGIDVRDVAEERLGVLHLKDTHGAEIIRVDHDGPAGRMGLRERDVVLQMNGTAIEGEEQLRRMLHDTAPGRSITLIISRDGQQMTMSAQLADKEQILRDAWLLHLSAPQAPATGLPTGEVAAANSAPAPPPPSTITRYSRSFLSTMRLSPSYTGAQVEMLGPQLADFFGVSGGEGLLVRAVETDSPASRAGMRAGDVVMRANQKHLSSVGDWARLIRECKGRPVTVVVLRDHAEHTLMLMPESRHHSSVLFPSIFSFSSTLVARR